MPNSDIEASLKAIETRLPVPLAGDKALRNVVTQLTSRSTALRQENTLLVSKINETEISLKSLAEKYSTFVLKSASLRQENVKLVGKLSEASGYQHRAEDLEKEVSTLTVAHTAELASQHESFQIQLQQLENQLKEIKDSDASKDDELASTQRAADDRASALSKEVEDLRAELSTATNALAAQEKQTLEAKEQAKEVDELKAKLDAAESAHAALENQLKEIKDSDASKDDELASTQRAADDRASALSKEVEDLRAELSTATNALAAQEKQTLEAKEQAKEVDELKAKLDAAESAHAALENQLKEIKDSDASKDDELASTQRAADDRASTLSKEVEDLRAELAAAEETQCSLQEKVSELEAATTATSSEPSKNGVDVDRLREQIASLQAEAKAKDEEHSVALESAQDDAVAARQVLEDFQRAHVPMPPTTDTTDNAELQELKEDLVVKDQYIVDLEERIEALTIEQKFGANLDESQARENALNERIKELEDQLRVKGVVARLNSAHRIETSKGFTQLPMEGESGYNSQDRSHLNSHKVSPRRVPTPKKNDFMTAPHFMTHDDSGRGVSPFSRRKDGPPPPPSIPKGYVSSMLQSLRSDPQSDTNRSGDSDARKMSGGRALPQNSRLNRSGATSVKDRLAATPPATTAVRPPFGGGSGGGKAATRQQPTHTTTAAAHHPLKENGAASPEPRKPVPTSNGRASPVPRSTLNNKGLLARPQVAVRSALGSK